MLIVTTQSDHVSSGWHLNIMVSRLPSALLDKIDITTQKQKNITELKPSLHLYCDSYLLYSCSLNCCGFQGDVFKNREECPAFPDHIGKLPHTVPSHVMTVHPLVQAWYESSLIGGRRLLSSLLAVLSPALWWHHQHRLCAFALAGFFFFPSCFSPLRYASSSTAAPQTCC